jgi:hypothetical protein
MGTANFFNKNANGIYPICMDYEDEETGESISCESWDYDETRDFVRETLEESAKAHKQNFEVFDGKNEYNRNFEGVSIGRVHLSCTYYGEELSVYADCVSRSGYYEGANLDFEDVNFSIGNTEYLDIFSLECIADCVKYYTDLNAGLKAIATPKMYAKIEQMKSELENFINGVYGKCATKYEVLARFSNGETMYTKSA